MDFIFLGILTFIASFIGTVTGFGSSTIMLPLVALSYPFPQTLLFVGIIHVANDVWKIVLFRHAVSWKLIIAFAIPGFFASIFGAYVALGFSSPTFIRILGLVLLLYATSSVLAPKLRLPKNGKTLAFGGMISGFLAGAFGIGGPARTVFLAPYTNKKDVYIFIAGASAILIDTSRLVIYHQGGVILPQTLWFYLFALIPLSFIAAEIAKRYVERISVGLFRVIISAFLILVSLKFLIIP